HPLPTPFPYTTLFRSIELPVNADAFCLPGAQRVALLRVLDLQDLGAEIGELRGYRVAGDEPRQVDDTDTVERAGGVRFKRFFRQVHPTTRSSTARLAYRPPETKQSGPALMPVTTAGTMEAIVTTTVSAEVAG